jgi:hypothetical protein
MIARCGLYVRSASHCGRVHPDFKLGILNQLRNIQSLLAKQCAVKGAGLQRVQIPPGNLFAPPGSNRSGGRGEKHRHGAR